MSVPPRSPSNDAVPGEGLEGGLLGGDRRTPDRVLLYDSTLRDGDQTPGVSFTVDDKVRLAEALDAAGVPQIEAGFPPVGPDEQKAVRRLVELGLDADVLVLSRLLPEDLDLCRRLDVDLAMTFVPASDLHLRVRHGWSREETVARVHEGLEWANDHGVPVSFSTEDTTRADPAFLRELYAAATEHDVARVGVTDTVGAAAPWGIARLVSQLLDDPDLGLDVPLSVYLHDDLGLATANVLAGVACGAEAACVTVNGLGDRGGVAALEQVAPALQHLFGVETGIDLTQLTELSRLVEELSGVPREPHRPLVGDHAFAHESGIHVAAVLEDPATYEPLPPGAVGNARRVVLGKHSGRASVRHRLAALGVEEATDEEVRTLLAEVKAQATAGGGPVDDATFRALAEKVLGAERVGGGPGP